MVSFDLNFRLIFIKDILQDEESLCTMQSISWLSIKRVYYQGNMIKVFNGDFIYCVRVGVLLGRF